MTHVDMSLEERLARYRVMVEMRQHGASWSAVGQAYGVSKQRAVQIVSGGEPFGEPGQNHRWAK